MSLPLPQLSLSYSGCCSDTSIIGTISHLLAVDGSSHHQPLSLSPLSPHTSLPAEEFLCVYILPLLCFLYFASVMFPSPSKAIWSTVWNRCLLFPYKLVYFDWKTRLMECDLGTWPRYLRGDRHQEDEIWGLELWESGGIFPHNCYPLFQIMSQLFTFSNSFSPVGKKPASEYR